MTNEGVYRLGSIAARVKALSDVPPDVLVLVVSELEAIDKALWHLQDLCDPSGERQEREQAR
jgi:hypothetical protein